MALREGQPLAIQRVPPAHRAAVGRELHYRLAESRLAEDKLAKSLPAILFQLNLQNRLSVQPDQRFGNLLC